MLNYITVLTQEINASNSSVLQPILTVSNGIADTSELFVRSYQMYKMFAPDSSVAVKADHTQRATVKPVSENTMMEDSYKEFKVGKLAQVVLVRLLEEGKASAGMSCAAGQDS